MRRRSASVTVRARLLNGSRFFEYPRPSATPSYKTCSQSSREGRSSPHADAAARSPSRLSSRSLFSSSRCIPSMERRRMSARWSARGAQGQCSGGGSAWEGDGGRTPLSDAAGVGERRSRGSSRLLAVRAGEVPAWRATWRMTPLYRLSRWCRCAAQSPAWTWSSTSPRKRMGPMRMRASMKSGPPS